MIANVNESSYIVSVKKKLMRFYHMDGTQIMRYIPPSILFEITSDRYVCIKYIDFSITFLYKKIGYFRCTKFIWAEGDGNGANVANFGNI